MEFVANNDEINFDVLNIVNENLTVSEVALICKNTIKILNL